MKINKKQIEIPKEIKRSDRYKEEVFDALPYAAGMASWYLDYLWAKSIAEVTHSIVLMGLAVIFGVLITLVCFFGTKALVDLIRGD